MRRSLFAAALAAILLLLAALAGQPLVHGLDRMISGALARLPRSVLDVLYAVWVLGALPVTTAALLVATPFLPRGRRAAAWAGFIGVVAIETLLRRFVPTPHPPGGPVLVPWLDRLASELDPNPLVLTWGLARTAAEALRLAAHLPRVVQSLALKGSFPSGHVARLAFLAGLPGGPRRARRALTLGVLPVVAVVATGGHWLTDGLGALALAGSALALIPDPWDPYY